MKYIKTYHIFEAEIGMDEDYAENKEIYEKELGYNIYDMIDDAFPEKDYRNKMWLMEQLMDYKKNLEKHKTIKNQKELLYDKTKQILKITKTYCEKGCRLHFFKSLDDFFERAGSEYNDIENLIYQNKKWAIFSLDDYELKNNNYLPYKTTDVYWRTTRVYPWKELSYDIDDYPFDAENNTFIFIMNKRDINKSMLLRATFEKDYVLLKYKDDDKDGLKRSTNIDEFYDILKKYLKVGSIAKKVIEWVKKNTKFPVYNDVEGARKEIYEHYREDGFEYLYSYYDHFNTSANTIGGQERFANDLFYSDYLCQEAVKTIVENFNFLFKGTDKSLYPVFKDIFANNDFTIAKETVIQYLSDFLNAEKLAKDLNLDLTFDKNDSELNKYEKIFKHVDPPDYKDLIDKYSSMDDFISKIINYKQLVLNNKDIDRYVLEDMLTQLWGYEWFKNMTEQEWKTGEEYPHTTNALIYVFGGISDVCEGMAVTIADDILSDEEALEMAKQYLEDYWGQISV